MHFKKNERINDIDALILTMQAQRAFDIVFSSPQYFNTMISFYSCGKNGKYP